MRIITGMNAQLLIVKDVSGCPLLKNVVYSSANMVFVTSERALYAIQNGNSDLFPIGFRAEDVFDYDGQDLSGKINWKRMKQWSDRQVAI
jgi:hypothetical protein